MTDGENNKTTYVYDGHDRVDATLYPSPTKSAGTSNASDYEQSTYESLAGGTPTYDSRGNLTSDGTCAQSMCLRPTRR